MDCTLVTKIGVRVNNSSLKVYTHKEPFQKYPNYYSFGVKKDNSRTADDVNDAIPN